MAFWTEDKILIKNLQQLTGYTATRFLENSEPKIYKSTNSKRTVIQTYNSAK